MQRITLTTRVREDDDGNEVESDDEFIEISQSVQNEVSRIAMQENLAFGDAFLQYVESHYE